MEILYLRPYPGEAKLLRSCAPQHTWHCVDAIDALDEDTCASIEVLSVFVDVEVDEALLVKLPNIRAIATRSTGYDHIDMAAVEKRDIPVLFVPQYGTRTVAEYAFALIFALSRKAFRAYMDMQTWSVVTDLSVYEGFNLTGKTLGVVGTGRIGAEVCRIGTGLGMNVVGYDVERREDLVTEGVVRYLEKDALLATADIVTLHVPACEATRHLIDADALAKIKRGAYLINTARGTVVDTHALVESLRSGHLAGAGLDVLEGERELRDELELLRDDRTDPKLFEMLVADHALIDMPNVIVTPHIGFNTKEAKREITETTIENIDSFGAGRPQNVVSI